MLRRDLLVKAAAATASTTYGLQNKLTTTISSSRRGGDGFFFFSTSLPRSSSDYPPLTAFFRDYGIREEDANAILRKDPKLRMSNVESTLRPNLDFLRSTAGLTDGDISQILVANPLFLRKRRCKTISPSISFLKAILPSKDALIRILKRSGSTSSIQSNIEILKHRGVPWTCILKFLVSQPTALGRRKDHFLAALGRVEDLGLSPSHGTPYVRALDVMAYMSRSTFLRKVGVYRQLGWSEDQVVDLIRKFPKALCRSEDTIRKKLEFFREKAGWSEDQVVEVIRKFPMVMGLSNDTFGKKIEFFIEKARSGKDCLSANPDLLGRSLEKRIIPRCAVLNILVSRGLLNKDVSLPSRLRYTDKCFFDWYVRRYESEIPDVVRAFRGHVDFKGWDWLKGEDGDPNNNNNNNEQQQKKKQKNSSNNKKKSS